MKNPTAEVDLVWKALADSTRRSILDLLAERPLATGEVVARFEKALCRTAVMKHLEILVQAKLVIVRREGKMRWNYLNPVPIQQVCDRWVSQHVRQVASAVSRLKELTEDRVSQSTTERPSSASKSRRTKAISSDRLNTPGEKR
ncbi:MAG: winged helix-turn-helix transcriptional regulator [Planctomycetales bacterium]|nr:winged helix-turn-helix transcriptional regulator [Planctomycetales bacterium]